MRKCFVAAFVLVMLVASSSFALEKTAVRATDIERADSWSAATTCSVAYYNYCTGWIWVWSGWSPTDMLGVCFNPCCRNPNGLAGLQATWEYIWTGAPAGYGFTGTIEILPECTPSVPIAGAPFYFYSGWNGHVWGVQVPDPFMVRVTLGPTPASPMTIMTDHPAVGPTGPQACGYCYPNPRTCHSYYLGTSGSPYAAGVSMSDGICCVELVWDAQFSCNVAVEDASWANIKALYK
jgi:hypothetical protein